jgi:hypothetical protein
MLGAPRRVFGVRWFGVRWFGVRCLGLRWGAFS